MKHILLLGALFLFGATASAQSSPACSGGDKAKTECTKGKSSSCCAGKAASGCCSSDSKKKGKKKKRKADKEQGKSQQPLDRAAASSEEKGQCTDKKAKVGPAKGDL